jgi:predicted transcriptional regulator
MPMPPPKATTESPRDRQVFHEMGQLVRAIEDQGPQTVDDLARLVGATYWEGGRFDRALALAVADGLLVRGPDGRLQAA